MGGWVGGCVGTIGRGTGWATYAGGVGGKRGAQCHSLAGEERAGAVGGWLGGWRSGGQGIPLTISDSAAGPAC